MEEMLFEKAKDHTQILLRTARPSDAARLVEIYAPYVTDTAITFEYEVPSVEEFRSRIEKTLYRCRAKRQDPGLYLCICLCPAGGL